MSIAFAGVTRSLGLIRAILNAGKNLQELAEP
jgi:hypothetical protein